MYTYATLSRALIVALSLGLANVAAAQDSAAPEQEGTDSRPQRFEPLKVTGARKIPAESKHATEPLSDELEQTLAAAEAAERTPE